ncbi:MAG TPA: winged helix-turn-helix domain-containing protein [Vicinamibacteria bacterium]|nr:winged helix-turn-helix domain-containing protein [Vicinamibacteria bacterium]
MLRASNPLNETGEGQLLALRFGPFELDVRSGELRRNGTTVRLQPQPFKVLVLLASRPGEVVTREEVQAEVWPAGTFVDFEQSLNFCVRQIRAALGDNANAPRYLETLPRRGYRWIGGVVERVAAPPAVREWPRPVASEARPEGPSARPPELLPAAAPARPARRSVAWPVLAALGLAALVVLAARECLPLRRPAPSSPPSFQRMTFRRGAVHSARFGPDGQVVYTASWDAGPRVVHVARSDPRDFRALDIQGMVVGVSASGEVAFLRDGVLARAPLAGGPPKEVLKPVVAADWTADGSEFAVARSTDPGFKIEFPVGRVLEETPVRPSRLRLSPDARYLAIAYHPTLSDDRGLVVVLDHAGRRVAATPEWASLDGLAWAPGGREVWFTASEVGADNSVRALSLEGRVRPVLSGMGRLVLHDAAPDGRVLLERTTLRAELLFRRAGEAQDRDLSWLDFSAVEGISPDGKTVLFFESGQGGGPGYASFLRRTDGSVPVRVGSGRALDLSPDGKWVLSVAVGRPDRLDLTPTGPGENRTIRLPGVVAHEDAGFVGDGRRIYVTGRDGAGRRATWLTDLAGASPRRLPLPEGRILTQNTFSPDGSRFVASCPESGLPCFYDAVAGQPLPVPGVQKGWATIGFDTRGRLYFRANAKGMPEKLVRLDPRSGLASPVADLAPADRAGVLSLLDVHVAASGDAWAYSVIRRLSDLHVVTGLQ